MPQGYRRVTFCEGIDTLFNDVDGGFWYDPGARLLYRPTRVSARRRSPPRSVMAERHLLDNLAQTAD